MQLFMSGVWKIVVRKRAEDKLELARKEKDAFLERLEASETALRERNERMEFDLKIAQSAQKAFVRPYKPESGLLAVDYRYRPMDKVGGDYYSFFKSEDGSIGFFIGDVSGHGVAAALYIALLKSITDRMFREYATEPDRYLRGVNNELVDYISSNFITAIYGIFTPGIEPGTIRFRYSNGAHIKPIMARAGGGSAFEGTSSTLIGVSEDIEFDVNETILSRGDRVYLVTDGIPETVNEKLDSIGFGQELIDLFVGCRRDSLPETLDEVIRETVRFRNGFPQQDDITLIGFEVL
jgi:sigma-B regulation protein RsbU (phosphoserine phosphatase)